MKIEEINYFLMIKKKEYMNNIEKSNNNDFKDVPDYVICVTMYYELDPNQICRTTVLVTDLRSDKIVYEKEYWASDYTLESISSILTETIKSCTEKYNGVLILVDPPVLLEKCCNCKEDHYLSNCVLKKDYIAMEKDKSLKSISWTNKQKENIKWIEV